MTNYRKCLLTGGSGLLGKNLVPLLTEGSVIYPTSSEMDICCPLSVEKYFKQNSDIDLVIHAAAYTDVKQAEDNFLKCIEANIIGTFNILKNCAERKIKLVFISTDAVFDGEKGYYNTEDAVNPCSTYAKTKTSAELMVRTYDNALIIRTSFFDKTFPYDKAFVDQWTSKDYIDIMAPKILEACLSGKYGIKHVYSERRSLYDLAASRRPDVKPARVKDFSFGFKMPRDLSLK